MPSIYLRSMVKSRSSPFLETSRPFMGLEPKTSTLRLRRATNFRFKLKSFYINSSSLFSPNSVTRALASITLQSYRLTKIVLSKIHERGRKLFYLWKETNTHTLSFPLKMAASWHIWFHNQVGKYLWYNYCSLKTIHRGLCLIIHRIDSSTSNGKPDFRYKTKCVATELIIAIPLFIFQSASNSGSK